MKTLNTFRLDNGLRVIHEDDPQTAMVAVNVLYDVGARDESPELTGMAHLFEHLMFGGSANVPNYDSILELAGGTNNAFTSNDFTNFYAVLPSQNAETAFYLESDRMLGLAFSDKALEVQRSVVIEEFKQTTLNRPYGMSMHQLRPMLYQHHPYRWPVIGLEPSHIERVTQDDVRHWFYSHYAPNNAILAVAGNIRLERCRELAQKWFGPIPRRLIATRCLVDDPWPAPGEPRRLTVADHVPQTMILIAYRMDPYGTDDYYAMDAITDILSAGKSGRLYQRLMMQTDLFTDAQAYIQGSEHSGLVMVQALISREDQDSVSQAERMLFEQIDQLAVPGNITESELERSRNSFEANYAFDNLSLTKRAQALAFAAYHDRSPEDNIARYRALTLEALTGAARRTFLDHAPAILTVKPS